MALLLGCSRYHDALQRLANLDVHLTTQGQNHRSNLLGHLHTHLQVLVDERFISNGESVQMNGVFLATKILVQLVCIERRKRSQQFRYRHKASVEGLVGRTLVGTHFLAPEAFTVQAYKPVTEVVVDKGINESASTCGVIVLQLLGHLLNKGIE